MYSTGITEIDVWYKTYRGREDKNEKLPCNKMYRDWRPRKEAWLPKHA